jgi:uncharacterized protein YecA (UPF0149 family)
MVRRHMSIIPQMKIKIKHRLEGQENSQKQYAHAEVYFTQKQSQGRNEKCSCGSGKKFKNCCLRNENKTEQYFMRKQNG